MSTHLRQAWRQRIERAAMAPVRGIPLADLFSHSRPRIHIVMVCRNDISGRVKQPYVAEGASKEFETKPASLRREIDALEDQARRKAQEAAKVIENMGGIARIVLLGSGNTTPTVVLAEKPRWDASWGAPHPVPDFQHYSHGEIEPMTTFYNHLAYGSDDELLRLFVEQVAGGTFDDQQFEGIEEGETQVVYRGMALPVGADPTSSVKRDTDGVGGSWTLSEESAYAIAERGMAGFSGDNTRRNDVAWVQLRQNNRRDEPVVPTVLRAEVVIAQEGAAPYRPWSYNYVSEAEIDVPRGQEITLTGWRQADAVPVNPADVRKAEQAWERSQELEREQNYDDPEWMEGRNAGYYAHWRWGPWHTVHIIRRAAR